MRYLWPRASNMNSILFVTRIAKIVPRFQASSRLVQCFGTQHEKWQAQEKEGEECTMERLLAQGHSPFSLARHQPTECLEDADSKAARYAKRLYHQMWKLCQWSNIRLMRINETIPTILTVLKSSNNHVAAIIRVLYDPFALPFMWPRPPQEIQLP